MRTYEEFKKAVRDRESSDRYDCVNSLGYLGAYQFGLARLCDLGITRRIDPNGRGMSNHCFAFQSVSQAAFLNDPALQDSCFDMHVHRLKHLCLSLHPGLKGGLALSRGLILDLSGAIMVCHLVGPGALEKLIRGEEPRDANGTTARCYADLFSGFDIPL